MGRDPSRSALVAEPSKPLTAFGVFDILPSFKTAAPPPTAKRSDKEKVSQYTSFLEHREIFAATSLGNGNGVALVIRKYLVSVCEGLPPESVSQKDT